MENEILSLSDCRFEVLTEGSRFVGLGRIWIGQTCVRSGRLPMDVMTESFTGTELVSLELMGIDRKAKQARIRLAATFRPKFTKMLRDHSFDPIHDTADWSEQRTLQGRLDLMIEPASDRFNGVEFHGFAYSWDYASDEVPLFYLMDRSSWELDGDIEGATVYNQSDLSAPVVNFKSDTAWTTEGVIYWAPDSINQCMTHNPPRWVAAQCFDFQVKGDRILAGVFDRVDLVRTVIRRESGKPELKTFDKHIFDETHRRRTTPKKILLREGVATEVEGRNIWTWMFDDLHQRARDEFGLQEIPPVPMMGHHHWVNYTIDTYYRDIVPACAAVGIRAIFAENFKKCDSYGLARLHNGNMCTSHEYEMADDLGGAKKFKEYIDRCHAAGIANFMWTNTYMSFQAKINNEGRIESMDSWFQAMEDTRLKYGGAYTCVASNLDLKNPKARQWWIDCHKKIVQETGLDGFFIDSHYNLFFMPVSFKGGHPYTVWRESLQVMKALQDVGVHWAIEAFGPFGMNVHGHPDSYGPSVAWICYTVGYGDNYVTVPIPGVETTKNVCHDPGFIYHALAHKVPTKVPLFIDGKRIDEVYGPEHRRVLREYHNNLPFMSRRYMQEDNQGVLWHDAAGKRATLFNFVARKAALPGTVIDLTTGQKLPKAAGYKLQPRHTYAISGLKNLPTRIG